MTVGPWRPISLNFYHTRITDLDIRSSVSESLKVDLAITGSLSSASPIKATVNLTGPSGEHILKDKEMAITNAQPKAEFHFDKDALALWYPVGYGKQPIYKLTVSITDEVGFCFQ
jgi:beta-mannosidase